MTIHAHHDYSIPPPGVPDVSVAAEDAMAEALVAGGRAIEAITARSIRDDAPVTVAQFRALVALSHGVLRLYDLAEGLGVNPSSATRMCDRLVRKGLVTRERALVDRRRTCIGLTPLGQHVVATLTERRRTEVRSVLTRVPVSERPRVAGSLRALADAVERSDQHLSVL